MESRKQKKHLLAQLMAVLSALFLVYHYATNYEEYHLDKSNQAEEEDGRDLLMEDGEREWKALHHALKENADNHDLVSLMIDQEERQVEVQWKNMVDTDHDEDGNEIALVKNKEKAQFTLAKYRIARLHLIEELGQLALGTSVLGKDWEFIDKFDIYSSLTVITFGKTRQRRKRKEMFMRRQSFLPGEEDGFKTLEQALDRIKESPNIDAAKLTLVSFEGEPWMIDIQYQKLEDGKLVQITGEEKRTVQIKKKKERAVQSLLRQKDKGWQLVKDELDEKGFMIIGKNAKLDELKRAFKEAETLEALKLAFEQITSPDVDVVKLTISHSPSSPFKITVNYRRLVHFRLGDRMWVKSRKKDEEFEIENEMALVALLVRQDLGWKIVESQFQEGGDQIVVVAEWRQDSLETSEKRRQVEEAVKELLQSDDDY